MKSTLTALATALLLAACASPPPAPAWQSQAFAALGAYTSAYLSGNSRVANAEFDRARLEISATGRADLMARAELLRCATQVASLVLQPCAAYQALAEQAQPAEQAYAAFLSGRWSGLDPAQLPLHYRAWVAQTITNVKIAAPLNGPSPAPADSSLRQITDPLARLVAAGVLLQKEQLMPVDIALAVETASDQGWRRPLLAWLGVQLKRHQTIGNSTAAQRDKQRIELVLQTKVDGVAN
jgi:hypothetical protein